MRTAESAHRLLFKSLGAAELAALVVGSLYVSGYYVNSIFLKNYGIPDAELIRLEYVKIGFVFWVLTMGISLLPLGSFYLTWKIRRASGLPHFYAGWIGNSMNAACALGISLLAAFLLTRFEWKYILPKPVLGFDTFNVAVGTALGVLAFGMIIVPVLERLIAKYATPRALKVWFYCCIEPLRFGSLFFGLYVVAASSRQIPWLALVLGRSGGFIAVSLLLTIGLYAAVRWVSHIQKVKGSAMVFPLILFGLAALYYLAVTTYVYGPYPSIPENRGGRMPLTEAYFEIDGHDHLFADHRPLGTKVIHGPAYILEQTEDSIYFASDGMDRWFVDFIDVNCLRKEDVKYILLQRINDGFPRVPRKKPFSPSPQPSDQRPTNSKN